MGRVFYRTSTLEPLTSSSISMQHIMHRGSQPRQRIDRFVPRCCRKRRQLKHANATGGPSLEPSAATGQTACPSNGVSQTPALAPTLTPTRHSSSRQKIVRLGLTATHNPTQSSTGVSGTAAATSESGAAGESREFSRVDGGECSSDSSDSETETSSEWLRQFVCAQIDDFTDLNPGEKRLMTLWNMHQLRHMFLYTIALFFLFSRTSRVVHFSYL